MHLGCKAGTVFLLDVSASLQTENPSSVQAEGKKVRKASVIHFGGHQGIGFPVGDLLFVVISSHLSTGAGHAVTCNVDTRPLDYGQKRPNCLRFSSGFLKRLP